VTTTADSQNSPIKSITTIPYKTRIYRHSTFIHPSLVIFLQSSTPR